MKKALLILAIAGVCMLGACIPNIVFRGMDSATLERNFPLNDIPNITNVSASDLPLVAAIKKILAPNLTSNAEHIEVDAEELLTEDSEVIFDSAVSASDEYSIINDITYDHIYTNMLEFLQSGAVPEQLVSILSDTQAKVEVGRYVQADMIVSPTQTIYRATDTFGPEDENTFDVSYTVEADTHKVIGFVMYISDVRYMPESSVTASIDREDYMRAYVEYLGLDVLGDWEYNGNRLYSAKANLYINIENEPNEGIFTINVEL